MRAIIVNLTGSPLQLTNGKTIEPTGDFYAEGEYGGIDTLDVDSGGIFAAGSVPLMIMRGGYANLPDPAKNTYYVVKPRQVEVLRACGVGRDDILVAVYNGNFERNVMGFALALK